MPPPTLKKPTYDEFVLSKVRRAQSVGFECGELNPLLFDWQKVCVKWALKIGRAALFEDCGLGKAVQQMEWAKKVCEHVGNGTVLIFAPVNVANQTSEIEAPKFGYEVNRCYKAEDVKPGINITNYERLHLFDGVNFDGVVLDESSCVKNFMGKTRDALIHRFSHTPYRLCCTATPSPNDFTELGNHAEFLGVCSYVQMLATYFINDTYDTGTWRIKKHAVEDFWRWVSSWAICLSRPSDIGFSDEGFELPPLNIIPIWIDTDEANHDGSNGELFRVADTSAMAINKEMRRSIIERCAMTQKLFWESEMDEQWAIWVNLNDEQDEIESCLGNLCVSVRGADKEEDKINRERDWRTGKIKGMVSKGSIFGYGANYQHCHNTIIFPTYSHEDFYQIVRRFYRFGQKSTVNVYAVLPRTAHPVLAALERKAKQHETMREMTRYTRETLLNQRQGAWVDLQTEKIILPSWIFSCENVGVKTLCQKRNSNAVSVENPSCDGPDFPLTTAPRATRRNGKNYSGQFRSNGLGENTLPKNLTALKFPSWLKGMLDRSIDGSDRAELKQGVGERIQGSGLRKVTSSELAGFKSRPPVRKSVKQE